MKVEITVIIPTKNRPEELKQTIKSIIQNERIKCIIIVDDASTVPVTENSDRVVLIRNEVSIGEAASINKAIRLVKTSHFAIISDDDPQPVDWSLKIVTYIDKFPGYIVYFPKTNRVQNGEIRESKLSEYDQTIFQSTLKMPCLAGSVIDSKIIPIIKVLRPEGVTFPNDLIQWLWLSSLGPFKFVKTATAYWHVHELQYSKKTSRVEKAILYSQNMTKHSFTYDLIDPKLTLCAIGFRSLQILGMKNSILRPFITLRILSMIMQKSKQLEFNRYQLFLASLRVIINLMKVKIRNV